MLSEDQIIELFKALADPHRLQVFELLLCSDRTNSELMDATGLRQNLLSHHLTILAACGLIQAHQSIGDARRHYYSADLRTARLFRSWWEKHSPADRASFPVLKRPFRVLFLCAENGTRSLLAEALARHLAPGALIPYSAGIKEPTQPLPEAFWQVLAEHSVSASSLVQKTYHALTDTSFHYLISVCDIVHENLFPPDFMGADYMHWSLSDPLEEHPGDKAGQLAAARQLYDDVELRLAFFMQCLTDEEVRGENPHP